jgi:hypothetical protein
MTSTNIRQKLHNYIEVAENKKIKAIYTMVENEIDDSENDWDDTLKQELDSRYEEYKAGKAKLISAEESEKLIYSILDNTRKK